MMEKLLKEWEACDKIKVFEFKVIDRRTGKKDWVTFDISICDSRFCAQHVALNAAQEASNFIAFVAVEIDPDFSLGENLQELYSACQEALNDSEFYCSEEVYKREQLEANFDIFELPAFWASYLINGDCSGMSESEIAEVDDFLKENAADICCGCSDEPIYKRDGEYLEFYFNRKCN